MIHVPERYSYIEAYLTLRCNKNCSYCINEHTGVTRKREELSAKDWILGLNNIDTHGLALTLGGGEPTIHKGFYDIVNGLKDGVSVDLLTNLTFDVDEFIEKVPVSRMTRREDEYKSIRASYHPHNTDQEDLVARARRLQDAGYMVGIFGINHPTNLSLNVSMAERCRKSGVYFFVRDFLGYYNDSLYGYYRYPGGLNGNRKRCQCRTSELLISPDGGVYRCHRDLYDGGVQIGNILSLAFDVSDDFASCDNYGLCSPCDLKQKISPDLKAPRCSVEIESVK